MNEKMKPTEYMQCSNFIAEVKRTSRSKSASIKVEDGTVIVIVPHDLNNERISKLLSDKEHWIKDKLKIHRGTNPVSSKQYVSGENFTYLGRNYRLKVNIGLYQPIKLSNGRFTITLLRGSDNPEMVKDSLTSWYKQHAEAKLMDKTKRYAQRLGVSCKSIGIKSYKSRWGSCTVDGEIDFNWKIIIAPNSIVDYVVVHELCHLIHHDHSPKFWREVERVIPNYAECRLWLKENSNLLEV